MKISVIIPVYNTSKYLKKCIDSIVNQTIGFENIELILINDGSTDDSENIINKYLKKYKNIKYIYQENSGQAASRNRGLEISTAEYISFVDSDDWIDEDMLEKLYKIASKDNFDIVTCDYSFIINGNKKYCSFRFIQDEAKNFLTMNMGPCNMIIKNQFLKKINFLFPVGISYEDIAVIPILALQTNKIFYLEESLYNYYIRENSSMHIKKYSKRLEDIFKALDILYNNWLKIDKDRIHYDEVEYIYIRRLLMSASLRFVEFGDPEECISKISKIMKERFPNWNKNKYYKMLPFKQKIVAVFSSKKQKKILYLLDKINKIRK